MSLKINLLALLIFTSFSIHAQVVGAYQLNNQGDQGETATMIITNNYMVVAVYNTKTNDFIRSYGGSLLITDSQLIMTREFDSKEPNEVGKEITYKYQLKSTSLELKNQTIVNWQRWTEKATALAGLWRITDRLDTNGNLIAMPQGDRKTLKIMSGGHFQWFAINPATKQFSGTGGGTYTFENGKYTETIQFFSRDKTRVGNSLSFEATVEGKKWIHKGLSSTGNAVHEIWTLQ